MGRPFYADYVNHMLRQYSQDVWGEGGKGLSDIDRMNYRIIEATLNDLPSWDKNIVLDVYGRKEVLGDSVCEVAKSRNLPHAVLWGIISKVSRVVAKERGLL